MNGFLAPERARPRVAIRGMASTYAELLQVYGKSSRGQPIKFGPPAWLLGEVLTTPRRKTYHVTKYFQRHWNWTDLVAKLKQIFLRIGTADRLL
jgi:hypothetical protein